MSEFDHITRSQLQKLAEDLREFTDTEWATVTVCDPMTVRQLVAHLTSMGEMTRWNFLKGALRHRFDIDSFLGQDMLRYDVGSNAEVLAGFERTVAANRKLPLPKIVPPTETMIHADDIRRATGRPRRVPPEQVAALLSTYMTTGAPVRGKQRVHDLRLRATDVDWADGEGPEVAGPAFDLLLAIGGRGAALANCEGDGVETLRSRCR